MAFCKNCGAELTDGLAFCVKCGTAVNEQPVAVEKVEAPEKENKRSFDVGMLVWSLINMLLCCQVAGIISLIFTILARDEEKVKADKYISYAKISNIIGTVLGVLAVIAVVVLYIFMFIFFLGIDSTMYYY